MIKTASLLLELAFPVVVTMMFVVVTVAVCRARPFRWGGVAGILMMLGFAALVNTRFYHQVQTRRFLQTLRTEDVRRISVGDQRITDPEDVAAVVDALHEVEWFSANHGGWGQQQWFIIHLASGEQHLLRVALYEREEGAILQFRRPTPQGTFHDGYAFSRTLPKVLASLDIQLDDKVSHEGARRP